MSALRKRNGKGLHLYGQQPIQWLPNGVMPARIVFTKRDEGVDLKNKFQYVEKIENMKLVKIGREGNEK